MDWPPVCQRLIIFTQWYTLCTITGVSFLTVLLPCNRFTKVKTSHKEREKEKNKKKKRASLAKWGLASRQWKFLLKWTQRPFPFLTPPLRKEDPIYFRDNWREMHNVRMLKKKKNKRERQAQLTAGEWKRSNYPCLL